MKSHIARNALIISVIINFFFILFFGYVIHRRGGIVYLKNRFNFQTATSQQDKIDAVINGATFKNKTSTFEIMPNDTSEIIFLGNSITDYCEWHELFQNANIKNRGIQGDIISGVINRLDEVVSSKPKKIFIMVGINDLLINFSIDQILTNYERLINLIKEKSSITELNIQSILPTYNHSAINNNDIIEINKGLMKLSEKHNLTYINLFDLLKTEHNELDTAYSFDGVHLNGYGYLVWKNAIEHYVNN